MSSSLGQWLCQGGCGGRTGRLGWRSCLEVTHCPQEHPPVPWESTAVTPCAQGEASCNGAAQDVARIGKGRMLFIRETLNKQVGLWLWGELSQARGPAAQSTMPCANLQTPRCPEIILLACHRAASGNSSQGTDPFLSAVPPQGFQLPGQLLPPCPESAEPPAMKLRAWDLPPPPAAPPGPQRCPRPWPRAVGPEGCGGRWRAQSQPSVTPSGSGDTPSTGSG